jgi:diadenosine tetraphosphatase ApaH/serine/threonine PP2A family protein phosphatase
MALDPDDYTAIRTWIADNQSPVPENVVTRIFLRLMEVLSRENNCLPIASPIFICGDIHAQLDDLLFLFECAEALQPWIPRHGRSQRFDFSKRFLFMGDYVDRGLHSLHTFLYLACLKVQSPESIFLLRGNHETEHISSQYGFFYETTLIYGHSGIWDMAIDVFQLLPLAALIDQDVFCVHGGLSPKIATISKISMLDREREVPFRGPLADLLWSDPDPDVPMWKESLRGAGCLFGKEAAARFTRLNRLDFVARSHQLQDQGYMEHFAEEKREFRVITIWSCPNYMYTTGNMAAIMALRLPGFPKPKQLVVFGESPAEQKLRPKNDELAMGKWRPNAPCPVKYFV